MKLQNMFKKNRKSYIPLKSERPEVPEGLLKKCNKCGAAILTEEVKSAGYICPKCQGYFRVHAYERIRMTVDEDSFEEWEKDMEFVNPLEFRGYEEKVKSLKEKTGLSEAVVTGKASIEGNPAVIAVCDGRFLMASMGQVVGEKITRAVERATKEQLPQQQKGKEKLTDQERFMKEAIRQAKSTEFHCNIAGWGFQPQFRVFVRFLNNFFHFL